MYNRSLRNRIATSTFTLPVAALITLVVWIAPAPGNASLWVGIAMTGLTTYALMELNNRNALLRIRSRMVSTSYLALMAACAMLHTWSYAMVAALCFSLSYFMLFDSYQNTRSQGYIFHAFLLIGVASMIYPPMLAMALFYYFSMIFQLRSFAWRTFMAGLLGLMLPYWIYTAFAIWGNKLDTAFLYITEWLSPDLPDYSIVTLPQWVTAGTVVLFAIFAFVHFFHTAYNDKIRTRMFFYIIATQEIVLVAGLVLLPQHYNMQLALLTVNTAPLLAHYYALAKGRFADVWFYASITILLVVGIFNYIML